MPRFLGAPLKTVTDRGLVMFADYFLLSITLKSLVLKKLTTNATTFITVCMLWLSKRTSSFEVKQGLQTETSLSIMQLSESSVCAYIQELENSLFLMSEARNEAVKQLDSRPTSGEPSAVNADLVSFVFMQHQYLCYKSSAGGMCINNLHQKCYKVIILGQR